MQQRKPFRLSMPGARILHRAAAAPRGIGADNRMLQFAVVLSLLLHGLILSLHFTAPTRGPEKQKDRGLEVVLVNARHARAPDKADALAQANLDGGGNSEQQVRPKSPLPPQNTRRDGETLVDAKKRAPEREASRQQVLTRKKEADTQAANVRAPAEPVEAEPAVSGVDLLDSAAAIARMEAQIDRRLEEYAKRPRKKFIGARTQEYRFAQYLEDWRQKIERVGTLNYPDAARGKLYGSLMLSVMIRADGSIDRVEIQRSSGQKVLDDAAVRIVHLAAPFAPFPPDIRKDTDILEVVRTWTFTNADRIIAN